MDVSSLLYERLGAVLSPSEETAIVVADVSFSADRLHDRSRFSWAVIGHPSGAIAKSRKGMLLMRLSETAAQDLALQLMDAIARTAIEH